MNLRRAGGTWETSQVDKEVHTLCPEMVEIWGFTPPSLCPVNGGGGSFLAVHTQHDMVSWHGIEGICRGPPGRLPGLSSPVRAVWGRKATSPGSFLRRSAPVGKFVVWKESWITNTKQKFIPCNIWKISNSTSSASTTCCRSPAGQPAQPIFYLEHVQMKVVIWQGCWIVSQKWKIKFEHSVSRRIDFQSHIICMAWDENECRRLLNFDVSRWQNAI